MQAAGGKCVFSSEIDNFARATYFRNFGELPFGDIQSIDREDIPPHDVLVGGFPCQPFSIAGLQRGFEDKRGGLFFEIDSILESHEPKALLLENVGGSAHADLLTPSSKSSPNSTSEGTTAPNRKYSMLATSEFHKTERESSLLAFDRKPQ